MKANVLVCGRTGAGKTSLIKEMSQEGEVPDDAIGESGRPCTKHFDVYQNDIASFIDAEGMDGGQTVDEYLEFIAKERGERIATGKASDMFHCIWYCIDGSGARIQRGDKEIIRNLGPHVLVVITKAELMRKEQTDSMTKALKESLPDVPVVMVSSHKSRGLDKLVTKTSEISSLGHRAAEKWEEYYEAFMDVWKECRAAEINSIINWGAGRAFLIAINPIPLTDVPFLVANEAYMIYRIGSCYGIAVTETILAQFFLCAGASMAGKFAASWLPFVKAPIAASITFAVGHTADAFFAADMKIDSDTLGTIYDNHDKEAKAIDWKSKAEEVGTEE